MDHRLAWQIGYLAMKLFLSSIAAVLGTIGAAYAADLPMPVSAPPPMTEPVAATNWDGFYVGGHIGYGPGEATILGDSEDNSGPIDFSGFFGGVQAGYNFTAGGFVFGIQGDVSKTSESGSRTFDYDDPVVTLNEEIHPLAEGDGTYSYTDNLNWTGAVTGKIGYAFDNFLPYALGGVAFASNTITYSDSGIASTQTQTGYVIGAGLEAMLGSNLSAFGEYRYADYGNANYGQIVGEEVQAGSVHLTDSSVRVGLNYHF
jgi:outer membrane immunogenic protein